MNYKFLCSSRDGKRNILSSKCFAMVEVQKMSVDLKNRKLTNIPLYIKRLYFAQIQFVNEDGRKGRVYELEKGPNESRTYSSV